MELMVFKSMSFEKDKLAIVNPEGIEFIFTPTSMFVNGELLYKIANIITDPDMYEYDYTIFDMARVKQT